MRLILALVCAALSVGLFANMASANEATRTSVCIRVNRAGELVSAKVYRSGISFHGQHALEAIGRAGPFPPLPEGSPEYVDFHYDVVLGCTGWIMSDEMHLCKKVHSDQK